MTKLTNATWHLIDEDHNVSITESTDPLLQGDFDSYVQISERLNPGRHPLFNGNEHAITVDLEVTGLTMDFKANLDESRLGGLLNRLNVANLYLYADTIIIKRLMHFPQTNVHIYARRLIIHDKGEIRTTPLAQEDAARGGEMDNTADGNNGGDAGNIYIHVDEFSSSRNEKSLLKEEVSVPDMILRPNKNRSINRWAKLKMYPNGSFLDLEFTGDHFQSFQIIFDEVYPKKIVGDTPQKSVFVSLTFSPDNEFKVVYAVVGFQASSNNFKHIKKDFPTRIRIIYEPDKMIIQGAVKKAKLTEIMVIKSKDKDALNKTKYAGFRNFNSGVDFIHSAKLTIQRPRPLFSLNGAPGQQGQEGGLIPREKFKNSGKLAHPVSVDMIWNQVHEFGLIRDEKFWFRPSMNQTRNSEVFYAKIDIHSVYGKGDFRTIYLGNPDAQNPDSGLDAYKPGNGGNGGNGGVLHYNKGSFNIDQIDLTGGTLGLSPLYEGGRATRLYSTKYHIEYLFVHGDHSTLQKYHKTHPKLDPNRAYTEEKIVKQLKSRHGKDAVGKNGINGKSGKLQKMTNQEFSWLHPFMLERVVQYARDEFMHGNRNTVQWVMDIYSKAITAAGTKLNVQDFQMSDLQNEIRIMSNRLNSRLDYFGNPIGWIPRLSTVANIQLLDLIKSNTVSLIFRSESLLEKSQKETEVRKHLNFAIKQLNQEVKDARSSLNKAKESLREAQIEVDAISTDIDSMHASIVRLKAKIEQDLKKKNEDQQLFAGTFQLLAGLSHFVPVGQPFVGQIGDTIFGAISKIDIHSETPFEDGLNLFGSLSTELGDFISDNEKELEKSINSPLDKRLEENKSNIKDTKELALEYKEKLAGTKSVFESAFDKELFHKLKGKLRAAKAIDSFEQLEFYNSEDFDELLNNISTLENNIKDLDSVSEKERKDLKDNIKSAKTQLKILQSDKKKLETQRSQRTKILKNAGKITREIGKGLSGVAASIQTMMVKVDTDSAEYKEAMDKALTGDYKDEFNEINNKIEKLNDKKWKVVNRVVKLQQLVDSNTGSIINKLMQVATLSDQTAQLSAGILTASARLYLQNVMSRSRALLLEQVDNLIKSYQYRFLRRVDSNFYQIHQLVDDIRKFEDKDSDIKDRDTFTNAYDFAIRSQFNCLVEELLRELQGSDRPSTGKHVLKINQKTTFRNGRSILGEFNRLGRVSFRLHELDGGDAKGSPSYFNYRIANIKFTDIKVKTKSSGLSFRFGIQHSGISVIRNYSDKKFYFFTTRHGIDSGEGEASYRMSWSTDYNHALVNTSTDPNKRNNGLCNSSKVETDEKALSEFLNSVKLKVDVAYKSHLPAATSELTLLMYENELNVDFTVTKLSIVIDYEVRDDTSSR